MNIRTADRSEQADKIAVLGSPTDSTSDLHQRVVSLKDLALKVMQASILHACIATIQQMAFILHWAPCAHTN